jgi:hypothetical protein
VQEGGNELALTFVFRYRAWGNGYAAEAAVALLSCAATELSDLATFPSHNGRH